MIVTAILALIVLGFILSVIVYGSDEVETDEYDDDPFDPDDTFQYGK